MIKILFGIIFIVVLSLLFTIYPLLFFIFFLLILILTGIKIELDEEREENKKISKKMRGEKKKMNYDFDALINLSPEQQREILPKLKKQANSRLKRIYKQDLYSYALKMTKSDLTKKGYFSLKTPTREAGVKNELAAVLRFLNAKTSTIKGIKDERKKARERFLKLGFNMKDDEDFYNFINSDYFNDLKRYGDSEKLIEDIDEMMEEGYTVEEIKAAFNVFKETNISKEEVKEVLEELRKARPNLV